VEFGARLGGVSVPLAEIVAVCEPCAWRRALANGHGHRDFTRLTFEHSGYRQCQAPTCQAWILDALTDKHKPTPVDVGVSPDGNLALRYDPGSRGAYRVRYLKLGELLEDGEVRAMTHFKTCTEPERFRKPARSRT